MLDTRRQYTDRPCADCGAEGQPVATLNGALRCVWGCKPAAPMTKDDVPPRGKVKK